MTRLTPEEVMNQEIKQVSELVSQGLIVEVDPETAEEMGCFKEDALTPEEAEESIFDNDLLDEEFE